jgi:DNA polymerase-3 subunit alpha
MMGFLENDNLMDVAAKRHRDKADGQVSLFDMFEANGVDSGFEENIPAPDGVEWERRTKLGFEREILKMYVSDHPLSPYADLLRAYSDYSLGVFAESGDDGDMDDGEHGEGLGRREISQKKAIALAGMVSSLAPMRSKKGEAMAKFTLEDMEGSIEAIIFPRYFADFGEALEPDEDGHDAIVRVRCRYESSDRGQQILVTEVKRLSLDDGPRRPRALELHIASEQFNQHISDLLSRTLREHPGPDPVILLLDQSDGKKLRAELPTSVNGDSPELNRKLKELLHQCPT